MRKILFSSFYFLYSKETFIGITKDLDKYIFSFNILVDKEILTSSVPIFETEIGIIKNIYKNLNFLLSLNPNFEIKPFKINKININIAAILKFSIFSIKSGLSIESNLSKILSINPYFSIQKKYINIKFKYPNILKEEENCIQVIPNNMDNLANYMKSLEKCFKNINIKSINDRENIAYTYKENHNHQMHKIQLNLIKLIAKNSDKFNPKTIETLYNNKKFLEIKQKSKEFLYLNTTYIDSIYSKNYYEDRTNFFKQYEKDPILINFLNNSFYKIIDYINNSEEKKLYNSEKLQYTAIHEIGHALIVQTYSNKKENISINLKEINIKQNGSGLTIYNHTFKFTSPNTYFLNNVIIKILISLGGIAAEKYINNIIANNISSDLKKIKLHLEHIKNYFPEIYHNHEKLYEIIDSQKTFYQKIYEMVRFKKFIKFEEIFNINDNIITENTLIIDKKIYYFNENELNIINILFNHSYFIIEKFFNNSNNTANIIKLKNKIVEEEKVDGDEIKKILNI